MAVAKETMEETSVETEILVATEILEVTETWETIEISVVTETWVETETLVAMAGTLVATTEIWEAEATETTAVETFKEEAVVVAAEACKPREAAIGLKEASTAKAETTTRTKDLTKTRVAIKDLATKAVMMITSLEATRVLETTTMMILTMVTATSTTEVSKGMVTRLLDHCKPTSSSKNILHNSSQSTWHYGSSLG